MSGIYHYRTNSESVSTDGLIEAFPFPPFVCPCQSSFAQRSSALLIPLVMAPCLTLEQLMHQTFVMTYIYEKDLPKRMAFYNGISGAQLVMSSVTPPMCSEDLDSKSGLGPSGMFLPFLSCDKPKIEAVVLNFSLLDKWTDALSEDSLLPVSIPVYLRVDA